IAGDNDHLAKNPVTAGHASIEAALGAGVGETVFESMPYASHEIDRWQAGSLTVKALIPALAMPIDNKTEFAWPAEQSNRLDALQGTVTRVLAVGWRAMEDHFLARLRPLVKQYARVLVVTGGDLGVPEATATIARLREAIDTIPDN